MDVLDGLPVEGVTLAQRQDVERLKIKCDKEYLDAIEGTRT